MGWFEDVPIGKPLRW